MAKKKNVKNTKKKVKQTASAINKKVLPQNILLIGERVEENKNIYILQKTYKDIHKFTKNKTTNESGGMLIGYVVEEFGKTNIVINGFIEAKYCEATPTTLKFTHETWEHVHDEMEKKYPDEKIVGWIHTHPDFGIFLSEYDVFIHKNFFNEDYQVAYVVDAIQNIEGFYFWIDGNIERCKGFYVYNKTGAKIDVNNEKDQLDEGKVHSSRFSVFKNVLLGAMSLLIVFLFFSNMSQNEEMERLKKQQKEQQRQLEEQQMLFDMLVYYGMPQYYGEEPQTIVIPQQSIPNNGSTPVEQKNPVFEVKPEVQQTSPPVKMEDDFQENIDTAVTEEGEAATDGE
ncbi:MAG: hypothetical protein E7406_03410 [Ruminococcaceae bacterium]|nr:hypothetical protein [Oscillospiraceae bacterium]